MNASIRKLSRGEQKAFLQDHRDGLKTVVEQNGNSDLSDQQLLRDPKAHLKSVDKNGADKEAISSAKDPKASLKKVEKPVLRKESSRADVKDPKAQLKKVEQNGSGSSKEAGETKDVIVQMTPAPLKLVKKTSKTFTAPPPAKKKPSKMGDESKKAAAAAAATAASNSRAEKEVKRLKSILKKTSSSFGTAPGEAVLESTVGIIIAATIPVVQQNGDKQNGDSAKNDEEATLKKAPVGRKSSSSPAGRRRSSSSKEDKENKSNGVAKPAPQQLKKKKVPPPVAPKPRTPPPTADADSESVASNGSRKVYATAKGGFLAPTRAWLLHMGNKVETEQKESSGLAKKNVLKAKVRQRPEPEQREVRERTAKAKAAPPVVAAKRKPVATVKKESAQKDVVKKEGDLLQHGDLRRATSSPVPPPTLPKPEVSATFLLQARRPKVPAIGDEEEGEQGGGDTAGEGQLQNGKGNSDKFQSFFASSLVFVQLF